MAKLSQEIVTLRNFHINTVTTYNTSIKSVQLYYRIIIHIAYLYVREGVLHGKSSIACHNFIPRCLALELDGLLGSTRLEEKLERR